MVLVSPISDFFSNKISHAIKWTRKKKIPTCSNLALEGAFAEFLGFKENKVASNPQNSLIVPSSLCCVSYEGIPYPGQ